MLQPSCFNFHFFSGPYPQYAFNLALTELFIDDLPI